MKSRPTHKLNGLLVKMLREQMKYNISEFAVIAGISRKALWNIENGRTPNPRLATLGALSQALGVDVSQLIFKVPTK